VILAGFVALASCGFSDKAGSGTGAPAASTDPAPQTQHGDSRDGTGGFSPPLPAAAPRAGPAGIEWLFSQPAGVRFSKTEITVLQYEACVINKGCSRPVKTYAEQGECNWGRGRSRYHYPINCVTWEQAQAFCRWAGATLPTEKQWQAEASEGGKRRYPWGDEAPTCERVAWRRCAKEATAPVCSKTNGNSVSGLCDMSGNLIELVTAGSSYKLCGGGVASDSAAGLQASACFEAQKNGTHDGAPWAGFRCRGF